MSVRYLFIFLATTFTGLMLSPLPPSALADAPKASCDKPELRAEGRRSDPGSRAYKERVARRLSVSKWEQTARELHGRQFGNWQLARERKIECEHYDQPGFNGRVSCVAFGQPCDKR